MVYFDYYDYFDFVGVESISFAGMSANLKVL